MNAHPGRWRLRSASTLTAKRLLARDAQIQRSFSGGSCPCPMILLLRRLPGLRFHLLRGGHADGCLAVAAAAAPPRRKAAMNCMIAPSSGRLFPSDATMAACSSGRMRRSAVTKGPTANRGCRRAAYPLTAGRIFWNAVEQCISGCPCTASTRPRAAPQMSYRASQMTPVAPHPAAAASPA